MVTLDLSGKHALVMGVANHRSLSWAIADRLGNALVAPTLQYVPEGDYTRPGFGDKPGVISLPSPRARLP